MKPDHFLALYRELIDENPQAKARDVLIPDVIFLVPWGGRLDRAFGYLGHVRVTSVDRICDRGWLVAPWWLAAHLDATRLALADATGADQCPRSQRTY